MMYSPRLRIALGMPLLLVIAFLALRYAYPVYWDGAGPMPSFFYFGHLPTYGEYQSSRLQYDVRLLVPYSIASILIVGASHFIAPKLAKQFNSGRVAIALSTFVLLVGMAAVSDIIATTARINVGRFLALTQDSVFAFLIVTVPVAAISAMVADKVQ